MGAKEHKKVKPLTRKFWYDKMPTEVRNKFLNNCEDDFLSDYEAVYPTFQGFLNASFEFTETHEGDTYWLNVYNLDIRENTIARERKTIFSN